MKRLLTILILIFSLQTPSQADDIRGFQIEGISVGDSALDYYSKEELLANQADYYKDNTYASVGFVVSSEEYDQVSLHFKSDDKQFRLVGIDGNKFYPNNIKDCYKKMNEAKKNITIFLKNIKPSKKVTNSNSTFGVYTYINFYFSGTTKSSQGNDQIVISCYDYKDKYPYEDMFSISIETKKFRHWLDTIAY